MDPQHLELGLEPSLLVTGPKTRKERYQMLFPGMALPRILQLGPILDSIDPFLMGSVLRTQTLQLLVEDFAWLDLVGIAESAHIVVAHSGAQEQITCFSKARECDSQHVMPFGV